MKKRACVVLVCVSLLSASMAFGAGGTKIPDGNVTIDNGYLDLSPTGKGVIFPDGSTQTTAAGSVISVTGAAPLANTGTVINPVISLTGTVPDGSLSANVCTLDSTQTVSGSKTFSVPAIFSVANGTAPYSVISSTMVSNLNAEKVGGQNLADLDLRYLSSQTQPSPTQIPRTNTISTVDSVGIVGRYTAITIGTDGLPVISYYDVANSDLKVAKCGNAACSAGNTITIIDSTGSVGQYTSIAIGTDGLPVVSYSVGALKVAKCGNAACSAGNSITVVDSNSNVGLYTSITIGTDGLPAVSYFDNLLGYLKIAKCGNSACSAGNTITTVDSNGIVGSHTSITIGTDSLPVVSYYDNTNYHLKVAKCGNAACSAGNVITTVDSIVGMVGLYTSITIGTDGLPVISYYDNSNFDLKVAKCGNAACNAGNTITIVDSTGNVGQYTSITIGTDGLPVVSYLDNTKADLKVAKCGNAACSAGNTITTVDSAGLVGQFTSITIGMDGLPVISYYDTTNAELKVAKCANQFCINNWSRR